MPSRKKKVKPFYRPPTLLARQVASLFYFSWLTRWTKLPQWLRSLRTNVATAAGATGMGCIGFPIHPVWEVTSACNLRCQQCHASSGHPLPQELSTAEGKKLLQDMAAIEEFRMLVFTGGEPFCRPDLLELIACARDLGFEISIATNGTLLTRELGRALKSLGVANLAIGLNANDRAIHEHITRVPGSFESSRQAIALTRELGMGLQINTTVMQENREAIPELLDFASQVKAQIVLLYQMIPEGRGKREMELHVQEYQALTEMTAARQGQCGCIVEPTCAPQYWAYLLSRNGQRPSPRSLQVARHLFQGCVAGSGLCYVKPDGEVWACPFIPVSAGNVRQTPIALIWRESRLFADLRDKKNRKGACGTCSYNELCGGCRGRAYAHFHDYLAEDPLCFLRQ